MYRCENCKTQKNTGDNVYSVESAYSDILLPTCCEECARMIRNRELGKLYKKIEIIKNSEISKEIW